MEDWITRPIGEKFDYEGDMLEVVESEEDDGCEGCYFIDSMFCHKGKVLYIAGYCFSSARKDKKDIVFKKVE